MKEFFVLYVYSASMFRKSFDGVFLEGVIQVFIKALRPEL